MAVALNQERRFFARANSRKLRKLSPTSSGCILFEENWLSARKCEQLVALYKRFWNPKVGQSYDGNNILDDSVLLRDGKIEFYLWRVAEKLRKRVQNFSGVRDLLIESLFLVALVKGGFHKAHADNERYVRNRWVPNHTPHRDYSAIVYLNSDFTGGELCFPEHNVCISPSRGSLVAFPSSGEFVHTVQRVSSGIRYSMPVWFTTERRFAVWDE